MKMIKKVLLYGLPLSFSLMLGACATDEPEKGKDNLVEKSETRYLRVNLINSGQSNTRAQDPTYANGTPEENTIRTLDFYFYDADKNFHSHVPMSINGPEIPELSTTSGTVDRFFETDVPVSLVQGEKMPSYVLCVVNGVNRTGYADISMSEAQARTLNNIYASLDGADKDKYFGMNNSVYYGRDEVTGEDNQLIMATPFDSNKLKTQTELEKMDEEQKLESVLDIYVERYAAKVNFTLESGAVQEYAASNGVTLTFVPEAWDVNCYEESFYFIKSYRTSENQAVYTDFNTMDALFNWKWNNPDDYRSFWSRTPAYYSNNYPTVADDILDLPAAQQKTAYTTKYRSFAGTNTAPGTPVYLGESTVSAARLTGDGMDDQYLPLTSIPSVVLKGKYKVNGKSGITFYAYQKGSGANKNMRIYADKTGEIGEVQTVRDVMLNNQSIVCEKISDNSYIPLNATDINSENTAYFVVEHPAPKVREGIKVGGDLVTLQFKAENSDYYYYDSAAGWQKINSTNINKVNRLLYQNLGGAHKFTEGMAFFSAPIQHWGWYRDDNENYGKSLDEWEWEKMKVGDFGIVRNHVYTVQVNKISGLGTGVIDEDDPMLPPTDKVGYAVHFHVNIQKWATLPVQKWEW